MKGVFRVGGRGRVGLATWVACLVALAAPAFAEGAAGDLDPSFGVSGKAMTDFARGAEAAGVAIDSQGRVVAVGRRGGDEHFVLARYLPDGNLDPSFGDGGKVTTDLDPYWANAVAIDAQDRVVVTGYHYGSPPKFLVARYAEDGQLDNSFSEDGVVRTGIGRGAGAQSVQVDAQGRILVAGATYDDEPPVYEGWGFAVARYLSDGSLDGSFGDGGTATTNLPDDQEFAHSAAIDAQGRIVLAGTTTPSDFDLFSVELTRYLSDGSADTSFGHAGVVRTSFDWDSGADAVAIDARDRMVVAGSAQARHGPDNFALARYLPNGTLDSSFGRDGVVKTPVRGNGGATSVAIDSRSRIVAAGNGYDTFRVARYLPNGHLDDSFAGDGIVTMGAADPAIGDAVVIDAQDRIVAAGTDKGELGSAGGDFLLVRYFGDGPMLTISGPSRIGTARRRARATFAFQSDEQASFECKVGRTAFKPCSSPFTTRRLRSGRHRLKVRATDNLGSREVESKRFKVVRVGP